MSGDVEVVAGDEGQQVGVERTGDARDRRARREREHLQEIVRQADALRGNLVFLHRAHGESEPRPLQHPEVRPEREDDQHEPECVFAGGDVVVGEVADVPEAERTVGADPGHLPGIRAGGVDGELTLAAVLDVVEHHADDLDEGDGGNRQVEAAQPQGRNRDGQAHDGGGHRAGDGGREDVPAVDGGQRGAGEGADGEESRLAQRHDPGHEARVDAPRQDRVDADQGDDREPVVHLGRPQILSSIRVPKSPCGLNTSSRNSSPMAMASR